MATIKPLRSGTWEEGAPAVRPLQARQDAIEQARAAAHQRAYRAGYQAGVAWGVICGFCWGCFAGAAVTAAAFKLGSGL